MSLDWIRSHCMSLPHTTEQIQWGDNLVFKIGGKIYAVTPMIPHPVRLSFKCTPEDFAVLCSLMLGGGKWGDVRLLSPATVRMMTSNRLNDLPKLDEPVRRTQPGAISSCAGAWVTLASIPIGVERLALFRHQPRGASSPTLHRKS